MTLLEVVMASTIASIVIAAATSSVMAIYNSVRETEIRASLDAEAKMLVDYIGNSLRPVGGTSEFFRPWALIGVLNNCTGCNGTDRLVFAEILNDGVTKECKIKTVTGKKNIDFEDVPSCCITTGQWADNMLALGTNDTGNEVISVRLTNTNSSGSNCKATFVSDPTDDPIPQVGALQWPANKKFLAGGAVGLVTITEIWLDTATKQLKLTRYNKVAGPPSNAKVYRDSAGNESSIEWVIADEVYDFQLGMGYDTPPTRDGHVTYSGTTTDEWLYNASGDGASGVVLPGTEHSDLRMMVVGITLGAKSRSMGGNRVQMLDGPAVSVPRRFLRPMVARIGLRNLFLFEI